MCVAHTKDFLMTLAFSLENNKSKNFDYLHIIPEGKN